MGCINIKEHSKVQMNINPALRSPVSPPIVFMYRFKPFNCKGLRTIFEVNPSQEESIQYCNQ